MPATLDTGRNPAIPGQRKPERRRRARLLLAGLLGLAACGGPEQYLGDAERELGVGRTWYGSDLRIYHAALMSPNGLGLRQPGYLVGVENLHPETTDFLRGTDPTRPRGERHVLTHIVRYHLSDSGAPQPQRVGTCALFTLLDRAETDPARRLFENCQLPRGSPPDRLATSSDSQGEAIKRLRESLAEVLSGAPAAAPYSHVLVMVMGWNTDQERALRNFDSLAGNLADEARARGFPFRPLVVGVTWPSQWQLGDWSVVPDPLVRGLSFPFKRRDANDTGVHVLRDLILAGVLPARAAAAGERGGAVPPVVMIGHSFGARALVRALATQRAGNASFRPEDRLVLLSGAFEFEDLFQKGGDGPLAEAFLLGRPRVTMTASRHDSAVAAAILGQYAGDIDTFDKVCRGKAGRSWTASQIPTDLAEVGCGEVGPPTSTAYGLDVCTPTPDAGVRPVRGLEGKPVRYLDASRLVNCEAPFSGGGAHGDIFRRETAAFLWDEIR